MHRKQCLNLYFFPSVRTGINVLFSYFRKVPYCIAAMRSIVESAIVWFLTSTCLRALCSCFHFHILVFRLLEVFRVIVLSVIESSIFSRVFNLCRSHWGSVSYFMFVSKLSVKITDVYISIYYIIMTYTFVFLFVSFGSPSSTAALSQNHIFVNWFLCNYRSRQQPISILICFPSSRVVIFHTSTRYE